MVAGLGRESRSPPFFTPLSGVGSVVRALLAWNVPGPRTDLVRVHSVALHFGHALDSLDPIFRAITRSPDHRSIHSTNTCQAPPRRPPVLGPGRQLPPGAHLPVRRMDTNRGANMSAGNAVRGGWEVALGKGVPLGSQPGQVSSRGAEGRAPAARELPVSQNRPAQGRVLMAEQDVPGAVTPVGSVGGEER